MELSRPALSCASFLLTPSVPLTNARSALLPAVSHAVPEQDPGGVTVHTDPPARAPWSTAVSGSPSHTVGCGAEGSCPSAQPSCQGHSGSISWLAGSLSAVIVGRCDVWPIVCPGSGTVVYLGTGSFAGHRSRQGGDTLLQVPVCALLRVILLIQSSALAGPLNVCTWVSVPVLVTDGVSEAHGVTFVSCAQGSRS
ncbi:hypothetical protein TREES_T100021479 [Tupaia chinensis]|uniref:Uncharacterized protein n=1 Tax=Tupaia chinensis TaxID=246437 RepID=L9KHD1_TUPCH|nr:hypothetical protein TREES_T100021479 [Tupaia chinensis]